MIRPQASIGWFLLLLCLALVGMACSVSRTDGGASSRIDDLPDRSAGLLAVVEEWRMQQRRGDLDHLAEVIAPAAPDFVDSRSQAAVADNSRRMRAGSYGYELLAARTDGDAGVVALLVAWTDRDGPRCAIWPFYCWFHEGRWKYLPNPGQVETWYQDVPETLEQSYQRLATWLRSYQAESTSRLDEPPATMIARWGLANPAHP